MSYCFICGKPAAIEVETYGHGGGLLFSLCNEPECHKQLFKRLYDDEKLDKDISHISFKIHGKVHKFPNDKRVIRGIAGKLKEILHGK